MTFLSVIVQLFIDFKLRFKPKVSQQCRIMIIIFICPQKGIQTFLVHLSMTMTSSAANCLCTQYTYCFNSDEIRYLLYQDGPS
jgi:hypothetical protein